MNTLQTVLQLKKLLLNSRPFRNSQKVFNLIALLETDLTPPPVEENIDTQVELEKEMNKQVTETVKNVENETLSTTKTRRKSKKSTN